MYSGVSKSEGSCICYDPILVLPLVVENNQRSNSLDFPRRFYYSLAVEILSRMVEERKEDCIWFVFFCISATDFKAVCV